MNRLSLLCLCWAHTEKLCEQLSHTDYVFIVLTTLHTEARKADSETGRCQKASVCRKNNKHQLVEISVWEATHRFTLPQFLLSTVKVKIHIQALHKLSDRIFIGVRFLQKNIALK